MSKLIRKCICNEKLYNQFIRQMLGNKESEGLLGDLRFLKSRIKSLQKEDLELLRAYVTSMENKFFANSLMINVFIAVVGFFFALSVPIKFNENEILFALCYFACAIIYVTHLYAKGQAHITLGKEMIELRLKEIECEEKSNT